MKITDYLNHDGEPAYRIGTVFVFANGNVAVCDGRGKQIPKLQSPYMMAEIERLADPLTKWLGRSPPPITGSTVTNDDNFPIRIEYLPHRMVYAVIRKIDNRELWHCDRDAFYHSGMDKITGSTVAGIVVGTTEPTKGTP